MNKALIILSLIFITISCANNDDKEDENGAEETWIIKETETKTEIVSNEEKKDTTTKVVANTSDSSETNSLSSKVVSKDLDIKFYSQFPLTWSDKYNEPYQNFCEEASLLNWYYYLMWMEVEKDKYIEDLNKFKVIEDKLYWEYWYMHTSMKQNLEILLLFQNLKYLDKYLESKSEEEKNKLILVMMQDTMKNSWIWGNIISDPTIEDIENNINNWKPVIIPLYWKWLSNPYYNDWGPIYHNILIKWFTEEDFISNEVWITRWDSFKYKKDVIMNNLYDYDPSLYPDKFTTWESSALVLFKYDSPKD